MYCMEHTVTIPSRCNLSDRQSYFFTSQVKDKSGIVAVTLVICSIKKELLSHTLQILTKINSGDICVQSSKNESVALLRQTHPASHLISEENSQVAGNMLIAVYRRLGENLMLSP